jgi:hypothetical protein
MKKQLLLTLVAVIGLTNLSIFAQTGFTCNQAIAITSLPYITTDNTANYGDTYDVIQPSSCVTASGNYMGGNDVFYSYTPTANETINIKMTPTSGWSGIFVYDGCSNVGVTCVGGVANSSNALREIASLNVIAGHNYIIAISTYPTPQTVGYTLQIQSVTCATPNLITTNSITTNSLNLEWNNSANSNSWEVYVAPCGTAGPSSTTSGTVITSNPYTITGLNTATCYTIYIRSLCSPTDMSQWSTGVTVTTLSTPPPAPVCGGQFIDNGGLTSNYANNSDNTYTICPTNPGDQVTVTFSSFDIETNWDGLYVFNGSSIVSTQISSSNGAGNVPGGLAGSYWGSTIPGPFTSSDLSGCLTFRFRSDNSLNKAGWVANVECYPPASCVRPTIASTTNITGSNATVNWIENGTATQWEILVLPSTASAPLQTDSGTSVSSNTYQITGLQFSTAYKVYVKSICSTSDSSFWSNASFFTTASTNCFTPTNLAVNAITGTSANVSWIQSGTVSQWEVLVQPTGSPTPNATTSGTLTPSNSYFISGLTSGVAYTFYVRAVCSSTETSNWSVGLSFTPYQSFPPIITNTTQFTVDQLVTNVLINNPCINVSKISSRTGTNFGSVNGIGYFTNTNSLFPISSGIILSTGNALNAHGPNNSTLSDGTSAWTGDADLFNYIQGLGIDPSLSSYNNASVLEFDFSSLNAYMSFNFLFASDEYGTYQCSFADAFAFMLTDLDTGVTSNLAVVPGTTTPVSVITIRNGANNNTCTSSNPAFFDTYSAPPSGAANGASTNFNGQTVKMTASSTIIPNHNYHIKLVIADRNDNAFDSAVFIEAGTFAAGPPECSDKIELVAFIDENGNGIKDTDEVNFTYGSFTSLQNNTGNTTNISSPFGTHTIFDANPTNVYDFGYQVDSEYAPYYTLGTINYNDINIPLGSGTQTLYFPVTLTQAFNDVSVSIIPLGAPRPGFSYVNKIAYKNLGITTADGTITFNKDANVAITNVSQVGTVANANGFTYNFTNLSPYETRYIYVTMSVPAIPTVNLGDLLTNTASISAIANDINSNNNIVSNTQIVVASYDPNDKMEAHGEKIQINQFTSNDYLYYTIRFQNNGTANAINIHIQDFLDSRIDEQSIRVVDASHKYIMERVNNQINWKFDYIQLPSYLENFDLSKGYVTFKVKLKPGFSAGDIIPNTASIYFDTNPAIITNTFQTEFVAALSNTIFESNNLLIYPNPTNSSVQINLQNTTEKLSSLVIYDVVGKTIKTIKNSPTNDLNLDVSDLSKGVYLVEITTETNLKLTKKLIIQ